jgi:hypothetical protein
MGIWALYNPKLPIWPLIGLPDLAGDLSFFLFSLIFSFPKCEIRLEYFWLVGTIVVLFSFVVVVWFVFGFAVAVCDYHLGLSCSGTLHGDFQPGF